MTTVPTFTATIYIGTRIGRTDDKKAICKPIDVIHRVCQEFCDGIGLCVTVTPTKFIYTKGGEPGAIIGLINYPRFPTQPENLKFLALRLAENLQRELEQRRVTVVMPGETIMLGDDERGIDFDQPLNEKNRELRGS